MLPMVEARMIARIIQQIMIMIFFCSSRQGKKTHEKHHRKKYSAGRRVHVDMEEGTKEESNRRKKEMDLASRTQNANRNVIFGETFKS